MEKDDVDKIVRWLELRKDKKNIMDAYKVFLKQLKKDNPVEFDRFLTEEKTFNEFYYKEVTNYGDKIIDYIQAQQDKGSGITGIDIDRVKKRLTHKQQKVFELYYGSDMNIKDIASILNCSIQAVYDILKRIKIKLKIS